MRLIIILMLSSGYLFGKADSSVYSYDTIPNWQIFYDGKLVVKGNANGQIEKLIDTVFYRPGSKYLTILYNYDAVDPDNKVIEIWNGNNLLTKETFDKGPFQVNLWDILSNKTKGRIVEVEIYYSDDSIKNKRLIGKLTIFFPYRPTYSYPNYDKKN